MAHSLNVPLKSFFDFADLPSKSKAFERKLSKLTAFLRTLSIKDLSLIHEILAVVFKKLKA